MVIFKCYFVLFKAIDNRELTKQNKKKTLVYNLPQKLIISLDLCLKVSSRVFMNNIHNTKKKS